MCIFPSDADTDVKDRNSMTPLMLATRNGREEVKCVSYLVTWKCKTLDLHKLHVHIVYHIHVCWLGWWRAYDIILTLVWHYFGRTITTLALNYVCTCEKEMCTSDVQFPSLWSSQSQIQEKCILHIPSPQQFECWYEQVPAAKNDVDTAFVGTKSRARTTNRRSRVFIFLDLRWSSCGVCMHIRASISMATRSSAHRLPRH